MDTNGWWDFYKTIAENGNVILFPIFVLGTIVTLIAGYPSIKDWWAKRSKKSFIKRLNLNRKKFQDIEIFFNQNTSVKIADLFNRLALGLALFCAGFLFFAFWVFLSLNRSYVPVGIEFVVFVFIQMLFYLATYESIQVFIRLRRYTTNLIYPFDFAKNIIKFIKQGEEKGFINSNESELIEKILHSDLFDNKARSDLRVLASGKSDLPLEVQAAILKSRQQRELSDKLREQEDDNKDYNK